MRGYEGREADIIHNRDKLKLVGRHSWDEMLVGHVADSMQ